MATKRFYTVFKTLLASIFLLVTSSNMYAQEASTIITDRPDLTESAFSVEKGQLQLEIGIMREAFSSLISSQTPNYLIRYGMGGNFEFRLAGAIENPEFLSFDLKPQVSPIEFGFKYEVMQESDSPFQLAVISHFYHTSIGGGESEGYFGTVTRLSLSHGLTEDIEIGYNLGISAESGSDANMFYTVAVGIPLADKLGLFAEMYGDNLGASASHAFDGGFTYLIQPNIQLDASAGLGLFGEETASFLSVGISMLF